jgi:hypothetical protein
LCLCVVVVKFAAAATTTTTITACGGGCGFLSYGTVVLSVVPTLQQNLLPLLSGWKIGIKVLDDPGASICWKMD